MNLDFISIKKRKIFLNKNKISFTNTTNHIIDFNSCVQYFFFEPEQGKNKYKLKSIVYLMGCNLFLSNKVLQLFFSIWLNKETNKSIV